VSPSVSSSMNGIGTLREDSLHAALKAWYAQPGDQLECKVDGYVIDLVRGDLLVEVQTGNFSAIRQKLARLLERHPVRLVYPIASERLIVTMSGDGASVLRKRKSPKHGHVGDVFHQLVHVPVLMRHPNLSLEVLVTREEVVWREDGEGSWRRRGRSSIADRRLLEVISRSVFEVPEDFGVFIPSDLPQVFTVSDLAQHAHEPRPLAQKMVYCLREMGVIEVVGKQGRALAYQVKPVGNRAV
jgi:hypothetical protein